MVSLRKYLIGEQSDLPTSLLRITTLLLEATALHAVDYDRAELETFQMDIRKVCSSIEQCKESGALLVLGGEAMREMENYNRRVERTLIARRKEVQSIVAMVTQTLLDLAKTTGTSAKSLRSIEGQIETASKIEDIRVLKAEMATCLKTIRTEAEKQQICSNDILEKVERTLTNRVSETGVPSAPEIDPITGLGGWGKAQESILQAIKCGTHFYVIALRLDRFDMINKRFGYAAGNQALMLASQHIAQHLSNSDQLFRWRGPAVIALAERKSPASTVRAEVMKMLAERLRYEVDLGNRTVLLPLSVSWIVFQLSNFRDTGSLGTQLDAFVNENSAPAE